MVYFQRIPLPVRDTGMYQLRSVINAKFCISDTPVFFNDLPRLETFGIRAFPSKIRPGHFFDGLTKCPMPWVDEKISVRSCAMNLSEKP
jgi:hypothetical protein